MPVNLTAPVASDLHPVAGVRLGVTEAGIRKADRKETGEADVQRRKGS